MPVVEISLPKKVDLEIDQLVDQDEYISRDQAIEGLLDKGLSVYDSPDDASSEMSQDVFTQTVDDQQDPAMENDQ